jgi:ElaB/YqjD/DUF883 family membrane-anchored ribosome-binding protein
MYPTVTINGNPQAVIGDSNQASHSQGESSTPIDASTSGWASLVLQLELQWAFGALLSRDPNNTVRAYGEGKMERAETQLSDIKAFFNDKIRSIREPTQPYISDSASVINQIGSQHHPDVPITTKYQEPPIKVPWQIYGVGAGAVLLIGITGCSIFNKLVDYFSPSPTPTPTHVVQATHAATITAQPTPTQINLGCLQQYKGSFLQDVINLLGVNNPIGLKLAHIRDGVFGQWINGKTVYSPLDLDAKNGQDPKVSQTTTIYDMVKAMPQRVAYVCGGKGDGNKSLVIGQYDSGNNDGNNSSLNGLVDAIYSSMQDFGNTLSHQMQHIAQTASANIGNSVDYIYHNPTQALGDAVSVVSFAGTLAGITLAIYKQAKFLDETVGLKNVLGITAYSLGLKELSEIDSLNGQNSQTYCAPALSLNALGYALQPTLI